MSAPSPSASNPARGDANRGDDGRNEPAESLDRDDAVLVQQVMRFRNGDGTETLYATLRGEFPPGQRGVTLYLGFCPPFPQVPVVEAEAIEGPGAMVKIVQVQNNGAQIDVTLEQPALEPVEVIVEVAALPATHQ
jgi:hypothetical protein